MAKYPKNLLTLIAQLKKLPGIGRKTAERFAFHLLKWEQEELLSLGSSINEIKKTIVICSQCGCLTEENYCVFCDNTKRNQDTICIISSPRDAYAIDDTNAYNGLYHVINHLLSPMDGFDEKNLHLEKLKNRIEKKNIKEIIIALDSTLEGDATSLFLKQQINSWNIPTSRIAFGLPVGSSLEYIDEGTLLKAFSGRQII